MNRFNKSGSTRTPMMNHGVTFIYLTICRILTICALGMLVPFFTASAQFSPGELSRGHAALEGSQNCVRCHEVGKEIIGTKCLGCHTEIQSQIETRHGYHFTINGSTCVTCHKEHLGIDAKTFTFDEKSFDHSKTGFILSGAHKVLDCAKCHTQSNIKDSVVQKRIADLPHSTFLGLKQSCISCHVDAHKGRFKETCSSCHQTTAWKDVDKFIHTNTKFPLIGKHETVKCEQCHTLMHAPGKEKQIDFTTKSFNDCTPCHASPHGTKFEDKTCQSCHTPDGWQANGNSKFDHNLTAFKLVGRHAFVRCEQCHTQKKNGKPVQNLHPAFGQCINCHADKHHGEFLAKYSNNCSKCHNEQGYTPSTFTMAAHNESRFPLSGAHAATLCASCHKKTGTTDLKFHFENMECATCHNDVHKGSFSKVMGTAGCKTCHTTEEWKAVTFDHSGTDFPLAGKHAQTACMECHRHGTASGNPLQFVAIEKRCETCHKDTHRGQFAVSGNTECNTCHKETGWKNLIFDHETQSTFSLKGGHSKLECKTCHHEELENGETFIRFKPLLKECESCHQGKKK